MSRLVSFEYVLIPFRFVLVLWAFVFILHNVILSIPNVASLENNSSLIRIGRRIYLLKDGFKHAFPDRYTMQRMGYSWATPGLKVIQGTEAKSIPDGETFLSLWDHHPNVKILSQGNTKCIVSTKYLFPFSNPSIVLYNSEYVLTWRNTPHSFRIAWVPKTKLVYTNVESNLEQLSKLDFSAIPQLTLAGEDPVYLYLKEMIRLR